MNEKTIELLCEKFGTTVEYLIPKVQAYGIWSNVIGLIMCFIIITSTICYWKHLREKYGKMEIEDIEFLDLILICIGFISSVIVFLGAFRIISDLMMWITTPEIGLLKLLK